MSKPRIAAPTVILGLGTTGVNLAAHTRKALIDMGDEVDDGSCVVVGVETLRFRAIGGVANRMIEEHSGFFCVGGVTPAGYVADLEKTRADEGYLDLQNWLDLHDHKLLSQQELYDGAGQNRLNGRIAFHRFRHTIIPGIRRAIDAVMTTDLAADGATQVLVATSAAGGSGSAFFIDVLANLIRLKLSHGGRYQNLVIIPVVVLADAWDSQVQNQEIRRKARDNEIALLSELHYIQGGLRNIKNLVCDPVSGQWSHVTVPDELKGLSSCLLINDTLGGRQRITDIDAMLVLGGQALAACVVSSQSLQLRQHVVNVDSGGKFSTLGYASVGHPRERIRSCAVDLVMSSAVRILTRETNPAHLSEKGRGKAEELLGLLGSNIGNYEHATEESIQKEVQTLSGRFKKSGKWNPDTCTEDKLIAADKDVIHGTGDDLITEFRRLAYATEESIIANARESLKTVLADDAASAGMPGLLAYVDALDERLEAALKKREKDHDVCKDVFGNASGELTRVLGEIPKKADQKVVRLKDFCKATGEFLLARLHLEASERVVQCLRRLCGGHGKTISTVLVQTFTSEGRLSGTIPSVSLADQVRDGIEHVFATLRTHVEPTWEDAIEKLASQAVATAVPWGTTSVADPSKVKGVGNEVELLMTEDSHGPSLLQEMMSAGIRTKDPVELLSRFRKCVEGRYDGAIQAAVPTIVDVIIEEGGADFIASLRTQAETFYVPPAGGASRTSFYLLAHKKHGKTTKKTEGAGVPGKQSLKDIVGNAHSVQGLFTNVVAEDRVDIMGHVPDLPFVSLLHDEPRKRYEAGLASRPHVASWLNDYGFQFLGREHTKVADLPIRDPRIGMVTFFESRALSAALAENCEVREFSKELDSYISEKKLLPAVHWLPSVLAVLKGEENTAFSSELKVIVDHDVADSRLDRWDVGANKEQQSIVFVDVNDGRDVYVARITCDPSALSHVSIGSILDKIGKFTREPVRPSDCHGLMRTIDKFIQDGYLLSHRAYVDRQLEKGSKSLRTATALWMIFNGLRLREWASNLRANAPTPAAEQQALQYVKLFEGVMARLFERAQQMLPVAEDPRSTRMRRAI